MKEGGYESDSSLVFKKRNEFLQSQMAPSSPEQKQVYREVQAGGEVPFEGFRKPAPEKPKGMLAIYLIVLCFNGPKRLILVLDTLYAN